tara:strand:- start:337 stop:669 length:333 start_codon:yes stop_codon:yes gene_type:complete
MKLKSLLKESKVWERKFGEPLPTLKMTTEKFKLKQENLNENDLNKVSKILGKSSSDVGKFLKKHVGLQADDLLDALEASRDRRRTALMIMAAMKGNRRALKQLDNMFGFM